MVKKGIVTFKRPLEVRVYRASDGSERDSYNARVKGIEGEIEEEERLDGGLSILAHTGHTSSAEGSIPVNLAGNLSEEAQELYDRVEVLRKAQPPVLQPLDGVSRDEVSRLYRQVREMPNEQRLGRTVIVVMAGNIDGVQYL